jgi:hypothetical protein
MLSAFADLDNRRLFGSGSGPIVPTSGHNDGNTYRRHFGAPVPCRAENNLSIADSESAQVSPRYSQTSKSKEDLQRRRRF